VKKIIPTFEKNQMGGIEQKSVVSAR